MDDTVFTFLRKVSNREAHVDDVRRTKDSAWLLDEFKAYFLENLRVDEFSTFRGEREREKQRETRYTLTKKMVASWTAGDGPVPVNLNCYDSTRAGVSAALPSKVARSFLLPPIPLLPFSVHSPVSALHQSHERSGVEMRR